MNLAENIRQARLSRGLTQRTLAEALGVSDRAVSRWETGAATPDVTLLCRLALTLHTSADALLGVDPLRIQKDILAATDESTRLLNAGDAAGAVALLRDRFVQYPNQPELMVYLARALLKTKTKAAVREALTLCQAAQASSLPIRLSTHYGCKLTMAHALRHLGRPEEAARLVEDEMPAIFVSRELLLPQFASPERAMRICRSNVDLLGGYLTSALEKLAAEDAAYRNAACAIRDILSVLPRIAPAP